MWVALRLDGPGKQTPVLSRCKLFFPSLLHLEDHGKIHLRSPFFLLQRLYVLLFYGESRLALDKDHLKVAEA